MAHLIWTEPALANLEAIAEYIALEDEDAAKRSLNKVFQHVKPLRDNPESGSYVPELSPDRTYR